MNAEESLCKTYRNPDPAVGKTWNRTCQRVRRLSPAQIMAERDLR